MLEVWTEGSHEEKLKGRGGMKILAIFKKTKFGETRKLKQCRSLWGEYST